MKNATQNLPPCDLLMNSADRFYPARATLVTNREVRIDAPAVPAAPAGQTYSWWARSYNLGLPAVGGRYVFLRGAFLPAAPCGGWNASASWGTCEPSIGEAC